jgi:hypothetical protein
MSVLGITFPKIVPIHSQLSTGIVPDGNENGNGNEKIMKNMKKFQKIG